MGEAYTNIYGDTEVSGKSPDNSGDYYHVSDKVADFNYYLEKIHDSLVNISDNPTETFQIISGGVISDNGDGTIDISACEAIGYDENNKKRLIPFPGLSAVALPSGWNDGRQIWVVLKYDAKLGSETRTHKASGTYHYQLEDTYYGDSSGLEGGSTDDLFVDADPSGNDVILGSFTMTGTTYADQNVRSYQFVPKVEGVIRNQANFNDVIERTGANAYKIKDEYTHLELKYLSDGYDCYDTGSFLSDGDTWGVLSMNNCVSFKMDHSAYLSIGDTAFYLNMDCDDAILENVWLKGIGSSAVEVTYSFLQEAATTGLLLKNCKVSDRYTETSEHYAFYGQSDVETRLENCIVKDMISDHHITCFTYLYNLNNCNSINIDTSSGTDDIFGFRLCYNLNNCNCYNFDFVDGTTAGFTSCGQISSCKVEDVVASGTGVIVGFNLCNQVSSCRVTNITTNSNDSLGFNVCYQISGCVADDITSTSDDAKGFTGCYQVSGCKADDIDASAGSGKAFGFDMCNNISACYALTVLSDGDNAYGFNGGSQIAGCLAYTIHAGSGDAYGFTGCSQISSCKAVDIDSTSGTAEGFNVCSRVSSVYTAEAANSGNDFVDTVDTDITNKVSCPSVWT